MSTLAVAPSPTGSQGVAQELFLKAYRIMLLSRVLEEKLAALYRAGKIKGGVFLGKGQEALSVSIGLHLHKGDLFAPLIRDQAGRLAFGDTILDTLRTYLGSSLGSMRGRDGNIHRGRPKEGYYAMISHLGAMIPAIVGGLMAKRFQGVNGMVGATCIGDGGTSTGAFHEGLNVAAVEKLPLVLIIANNQYAYSTPTKRQYACTDLIDRAVGYGVIGHKVDGTNLAACLETVGNAVQAARAGEGPQMVVADLLRLVGHGEHDDAHYVDPQLRLQQVGKDCLETSRVTLLERQWASPEDLDQWQTEAEREVDSTAARVLREPTPDPAEEHWTALSNHHLEDRHCLP